MAPRRVLSRSSVFNKAELLAKFRQRGIKEIHAWNLWRYLIRNPGGSWKEVPNFPKAAAALLEAEFRDSTVQLVRSSASTDRETTKLLLELQDGLQVETVIMQYDTRGCAPPDPEDEVTLPGNVRSTVCVSSQVGCKMGCKFCATGTMGLMGNLTSGEIVEQLCIAQKFSQFRNVVFMGMGEPLDNYDNVRDAVHLLMDARGFGLAKHRITISTVGVPSKVSLLAQDLPGISLAFSLHAPTQELRQQIVPSARAHKLETLMAALEAYQEATQQRIFVEYVLLANVNDGREHAHQLGHLLMGKDIVLNLIPFNPIYAPDIHFSPPTKSTTLAFQNILRHHYNILCTVRQEKGQDIAGACGQLALVQSRGSSSQSAVVDIEDVM